MKRLSRRTTDNVIMVYGFDCTELAGAFCAGFLLCVDVIGIYCLWDKRHYIDIPRIVDGNCYHAIACGDIAIDFIEMFGPLVIFQTCVTGRLQYDTRLDTFQPCGRGFDEAAVVWQVGYIR